MGSPGICDRCGFRYDRSQLRKEWSGLMVCEADYDPPPRTLRPPNVYPEGLPLKDPRPEPAAIVLSDGDPVTPGDL